MIFWKQVGHSNCVPAVRESAVMCWPHTGHANLNSLMISHRTIPQRSAPDNVFFGNRLVKVGRARHSPARRSVAWGRAQGTNAPYHQTEASLLSTASGRL